MRFIGVYDYTVILTYISLFSAIQGIAQAASGRFTMAVICLVICGICDMFDGTVARTKKNRTDDEKGFGIQLDSLCDVISFGIFPAMFCYYMGTNGTLGVVCVCLYSMCAVIRLAFFNVLEAKRQQTEEGCNKYYRGLPVTSISIIAPILYIISMYLSEVAAIMMWHVMLVVVGFLFVLDFKVKKFNVANLLKK